MRAAVFAAKIALSLLLLSGGSLHAENWRMYGRNLSHSFSNPKSRINPDNVATLHLAWTFPTGDAVSASPTVVEGVVYVGSWDGYFYALDANSGALKWKFRVDCQYSVLPIPPHCLPRGFPPPPRKTTDGGIITSSAAVEEISTVTGIKRIVYFGAGKTLYALNAKDGSLRWKRVICGNPDFFACAFNPLDPTRIFSSPAVFGGSVFVGHAVDGFDHYRGGFEAIDAATGNLRWRFETDPKLNSQGQVIGVNNRGCGSVWSSAAVDTDTGFVFFGTSDCDKDATPPYHEAVIALDAGGHLKWKFRPRETDKNKCDFDFGASPNIIDLGSGRFVGIGGKDGIYYLLNRVTGEVVWKSNRVVFGGSLGGFYGAAFDERNQQIFGATGKGDGNAQGLLCRPSNPRDTFLQEPSMHALNAADGRVLWQQTMNHSFGATSLGGANPPGTKLQGHRVVFSGLVGVSKTEVPALKIYDAQSPSPTGDLLNTLLMPGSINSAATPVGNMLFVTSGNSFDGQGSGVHAFTP
jgi:polyvinyl alcohol dehydrogenase (cytochrome)